MRKSVTKIVKAVLGFTMAIGAGVGAAMSSSNSNRLYAEAGDNLYSSGEFSTVATHSYTQNKVFTLSSKSWTASVSQVNSEVFYLGCNSSNASKGVLNNNSTFSSVVAAVRAEDTAYNNNYQTAHCYALLFDNSYDNVGQVTFTWNGGNNAFQVYLFGDKGSGYELLDSVNYATSGAAVSGSVSWSAQAEGEDFVKFAIAARPGATGSTATNKTLRPGTFVIKEGATAGAYYTVTFDSNGGSDVAAQNVSNSGSATASVPTPAPTNPGYSLVGWYKDQGLSQAYNFSAPVTGDITLYAKWEKISATASYSPSLANNSGHRLIGEITAITGAENFYIQNGNNVMQINSTIETWGVSVGNSVDLFGTFRTSGNNVYNLAYCDITSSDSTISTTPITSLDDVIEGNLYKYCAISEIRLGSTFNNKSAGIKGSDVILYYYNAEYVNSGSFDSSDYAEDDYVSVTGVIVTHNTTVEIVITSIEKQDVYTVSFNLNAPSGVTPIDDLAVMSGNTAVAPANPTRESDENYDYTFGGWYVNQSCTGDPYNFSTPVTGDLTLYAKWNESERAASEVIENSVKTQATLAYSDYSKEGNGAVDTLDRAFTGISGNSYTAWSNKTGTSGVVYAGKSAGGNDSIQLRTSGTDEGVVSTANPNEHNVKKITVRWNTTTANSRSINIYGKNSAYSAASDLFDTEKRGTLITTMAFSSKDANNETTFVVTADYKFIGIKSSDSALYLESVSIQWGNLPTYTYSNLGIRFGGSVTQSLWERLATEETIISYGVLFSNSDFLGNDTIEDYYNTFKTNENTIDQAITEICTGGNIVNYSSNNTVHNPSAKATPSLINGEYIWRLYYKIPSSAYSDEFVAAAYIIIDGDILFLEEVRASAKSLAHDLIEGGAYESDAFGGSLNYLATRP